VEEDRDGNLVYAGRIDRMIKKRGYRIEPGDIESVLADLEGVTECAVVGEKASDGFTQLAAYLSMKKPEQENIMFIRQFCADKLPMYMIPEKIVFLKELPKTSSGKIDIRELK
jgi:acyl-coenzyme A synthetase/AMP-(fatty) acid ligase